MNDPGDNIQNKGLRHVGQRSGCIRIFMWMGLIFIAGVFTLAGLVCLNRVAGKVQPRPRVEAYNTIYKPDKWISFVLNPGAKVTVPYGVYGEYSDKFAESSETYEIEINSFGLRGPEVAVPKPEGIYRIVCFGDSSTFGWDTPLEKAYPARLQRALRNETGREDIEVINAGLPNFSSWFGVLYLEHYGLQLDPDLMLISFGRNDELDTAFGPNEYDRNNSDRELAPRDIGFEEALRRRLAEKPWEEKSPDKSSLRSSDLYRLLVYLIHGEMKYEDKGIELQPEAVYRVSVDEYRENLLDMAAQANGVGADVLFLEIGVLHPQYRETMRDVARELGTDYVSASDLQMNSAEWIKSEPGLAEDRALFESILGRETMEQCPGGWLWFTTDYCHPNSMGHAVIARELLPLVKKNIEAAAENQVETRTPPVHDQGR